MEKIKKVLTLLNTLLIIGIIIYLFSTCKDKTDVYKEIRTQRLSVVGPDGHLYIAISNPEKQALATQNGEVLNPDITNRDLPGLIFFNRVGDEVGGIYYDGAEDEGYAGITFDQQKNDQILAIMKDEYKDGNEWKRWYGMFLRERSDSVRVEELFKKFKEETKELSEPEQREAYLEFKAFLDAEINTYRMFLGREEDKDVGLFLYDSKGRERIKLFVNAKDQARLMVVDSAGITHDVFNMLIP